MPSIGMKYFNVKFWLRRSPFLLGSSLDKRNTFDIAYDQKSFTELRGLAYEYYSLYN